MKQQQAELARIRESSRISSVTPLKLEVQQPVTKKLSNIAKPVEKPSVQKQVEEEEVESEDPEEIEQLELENQQLQSAERL